MKKILLVFLLLGLLGGWVEEPNKKEETEISSVDLKEAEIYYTNGNSKYYLNDFKVSILDLNKAIELNPKFTSAYIFRAFIKHKLKQYEETIEDYNKAIELDPQYADTYFSIKYSL